MMGVDDERFDAGRDEMIEHESDERLLKNRDERLRQIFRQRAQPRAQSRAENKGLRDHAPRCRGRASLSTAPSRLDGVCPPALVLRRHSDKT